MQAQHISLHGVLEHVTFYNPQTHYTVARLKIAAPSALVTVTGLLPGAAPGTTVRLSGQWTEHRKYGRQFHFDTADIILPDTASGIRDYLTSGIIKGIGPSMADKIVSRFGAATLEVMETDPNALAEINGIGPKTAERIHTQWMRHAIIKQIMTFLRDHGLKPAWGAKIFSTYGKDALDVLQKDPYRLGDDITGIGFYMADRIARNLDLAHQTDVRAAACIRHLIQETVGQGHTFIDKKELLEQAFRLFEINSEAVSKALDVLCEDGEIVMESHAHPPGPHRIFPEGLHTAETSIAKRIRAMQSIPAVLPSISFEKLLANIENRLILRLSDEQQEILEKILSHRVAVISGGPGTGKTTLVRAIAEMFQQSGNRVCLVAPTGRSARRMTEITGFEAQTIHKLLEYNLEQQCFGKNINHPVDADILIVDEASMIDTTLMHHLMAAVPLTTRLILVGDADQLPSIGPGNLLADFIVSNAIPVYFLKTIFRQDTESRIIAGAHQILNGELPGMTAGHELISTNAEFVFIEQNDPTKVAGAVIELYTRALPERFIREPLKTIQVLTPVHKGPAGTIELNQALQSALNTDSPVVSCSAYTFKIGDKVMHLKNNYKKEVFNGEIGLITAWDGDAQTLTVAFEDRLVEYGPDEMDELTLGYAISVHKSQGSEYPVVIMPLITRHYVMLQRNLLYTAITRAQNMVILIGSQKALKLALANDRPRSRRSGLARRLAAG